MSMKLSYRDKVIAIVLVVLVILGVGIFCFAKPKYEDLQVSKTQLQAKEQEWSEVEAKMGTLDSLKAQLKSDVESCKSTQEKFLDERDYAEEYKISTYLMEKLADIEEFNIVGVNMEPLDSTALEAYFYNKRAVSYPMKINSDIAGHIREEYPEVYYSFEKSYPEAPEFSNVAGTIVTINYECDDSETVFEAVQKIADNDKNIYLTGVSGEYNIDFETLEEGKPKFEGEMTVAIYEVYSLDPKDVEN